MVEIYTSPDLDSDQCKELPTTVCYKNVSQDFKDVCIYAHAFRPRRRTGTVREAAAGRIRSSSPTSSHSRAPRSQAVACQAAAHAASSSSCGGRCATLRWCSCPDQTGEGTSEPVSEHHRNRSIWIKEERRMQKSQTFSFLPMMGLGYYILMICFKVRASH